MPPAFNLSQDQTLQFDLFTSNSIDVGPIPVRRRTGTRLASTRYRAKAFFASCEHQNFLKCLPGFRLRNRCRHCKLSPECPSAPAPTLIGCELLKIRPGSRAPPKNHWQRGAIIHQVPLRSTTLAARGTASSYPGHTKLPWPDVPRSTHDTGRDSIKIPAARWKPVHIQIY